MKKPTFKRIIAYLIDMFIIVIISGLFNNIEMLNPHYEEYTKASEEYLQYVDELSKNAGSLSSGQILEDQKIIDYTYDIANYGKTLSIISLVVTFLYFVVFQYLNNGKTIGKAVMKIQVITKNKGKLKFYQVLVRSVVVNSLLTSLLLIILIMSLSKAGYNSYSIIVQYIDLGLLFACASMILIRDDGRGLHDILGCTQVINIQEEKVKEANIVESTKKLENKKESLPKKKGKKNENRNS